MEFQLMTHFSGSLWWCYVQVVKNNNKTQKKSSQGRTPHAARSRPSFCPNGDVDTMFIATAARLPRRVPAGGGEQGSTSPRLEVAPSREMSRTSALVYGGNGGSLQAKSSECLSLERQREKRKKKKGVPSHADSWRKPHKEQSVCFHLCSQTWPAVCPKSFKKRRADDKMSPEPPSAWW